jgi:DNA-binding transcriptional MerR regulator/methylmalonyl-CoA mutase cobalamin-binding subunit
MKSSVPATFTQAQVELATGFSREVLRKWELRFGFPLPTRDARARRLYSHADLQRLQLIKQLLQTGHRPREVVPLSLKELTRRWAVTTPTLASEPGQLAMELLGQLNSASPTALADYLKDRLSTVGLEAFAIHDMPVFNAAVGDAWVNGSLGIHAEHLYTTSVRKVVQEQIARLQPPPGAPRVLLTTPPDEVHGLGILALHAALSTHLAQCIDLGLQTPAQSVVDAARLWDVSIVCISVGVSFVPATAQEYVAKLRQLLPTHCALWIGGQGAKPIADSVPAGVTVFDSIQAAVEVLLALPVARVAR